MTATQKKDLFGTSTLAEKLKKASDEMSEETTAKPPKAELKNTEKKAKVEPKLYISGYLDRKKRKYVARSLVIPESIDLEIKAYCKGGDLAILNYLIEQGLKNVKTSRNAISIDTNDIFKEK